MESQLNSYAPIDLSSIKKAKINSEKDLEQEITKVVEILKDTCKLLIS